MALDGIVLDTLKLPVGMAWHGIKLSDGMSWHGVEHNAMKLSDGME